MDIRTTAMTRKTTRLKGTFIALLALLVLMAGLLAASIVSGHLSFGPRHPIPIIHPTPTPTASPTPCETAGTQDDFATVSFKVIVAYDHATSIPTPQPVIDTPLTLHGRFVAVTLDAKSMSKQLGLGCLRLFGQWQGQSSVLMGTVKIDSYSKTHVQEFSPKLILDLNHPAIGPSVGSNPAVPLGASVVLSVVVDDASGTHLYTAPTQLTFVHS